MKIHFIKNKAQIVPLMIILIAILILAIPATIMIGEVGLQRVRLVNTVDSTLISAGSEVCLAFNQIRLVNKGLYEGFWTTQCALWFGGIWLTKSPPITMATVGITTAYSKFLQAKEVASNLSEQIDLQGFLYDRCFESGLIDELNSFEETEVKRDKGGKIVKLLYDEYYKRKAPFPKEYENFKKKEGVNWKKHNTLRYSFNKNVKRDGNTKKPMRADGVMNLGAELPEYDSYVQVELVDMPSEPISIKMKMRIIAFSFLYATPKPPWVMPCFVPHPWAWIRKIELNFGSGNNFRVSVTKKTPLFGGRSVKLRHSNNIEIDGKAGPPLFSVREAYKPKLTG